MAISFNPLKSVKNATNSVANKASNSTVATTASAKQNNTLSSRNVDSYSAGNTNAPPKAGQAPSPSPSRPELQNILQDYQVKEDRMVDWRPNLGPIPIRLPMDSRRMTSTEAALLDKLGTQRGLLGLKAFSDIHDQAFEVADKKYPVPDGEDVGRWQNDGHNDAFRHAYWSALLTKEFGAEWAEQFTTAHEGVPGNQSTREAMDLYNNEVGRQIALDNPNASKKELANLIEQAITDGKMVVINAEGNLDWSNNVPLGQHGSGNGAPVFDAKIDIPDGKANTKS